MNLFPGHTYRHDRTENLYVLETHVHLKVNGEWLAGVSYRRKDGSDSRVWVRTIFDFEEKFSHWLTDSEGGTN